jgi:hypothetical protein
LLQQLVKSDYKESEFTTVDKYANRLQQNPFFYRGLLSELEIIPYEKLWDMIVSRLNQ